MNLNKLKDKFKAEELEWRVQQAGTSNDKIWAKVLAYVDARAVMNRLDSVVGPENWKDEYSHEEKGVMCCISIKINDEWVPKWDGSPETDIESFKGGISKAFVRSAVKWGIGRYLYNLPASFADVTPDKKDRSFANYVKAKKDTHATFRWNPPAVPKEFLPED